MCIFFYSMLLLVDDERAYTIDWLRRNFGFTLINVVAPHEGFDAACQLAVGERFGQIIIAAAGESQHFVMFLGFGAEKEDWSVAVFADGQAGAVAIKPGHHHIENDQIIDITVNERQRGGTVRGFCSDIAFSGKKDCEDFSDFRIIINDEDGDWGVFGHG